MSAINILSSLVVTENLMGRMAVPSTGQGSRGCVNQTVNVLFPVKAEPGSNGVNTKQLSHQIIFLPMSRTGEEGGVS